MIAVGGVARRDGTKINVTVTFIFYGGGAISSGLDVWVQCEGNGFPVNLAEGAGGVSLSDKGWGYNKAENKNAQRS